MEQVDYMFDLVARNGMTLVMAVFMLVIGLHFYFRAWPKVREENKAERKASAELQSKQTAAIAEALATSNEVIKNNTAALADNTEVHRAMQRFVDANSRSLEQLSGQLAAVSCKIDDHDEKLDAHEASSRQDLTKLKERISHEYPLRRSSDK